MEEKSNGVGVQVGGGQRKKEKAMTERKESMEGESVCARERE